MISPSSPEPLCDVEAQYRALINPRHPKQAMWIAEGTRPPRRSVLAERPKELRLECVCMPEGILIAREWGDVSALTSLRDDSTLADILGYLEPKWACRVNPVVVRALSDDGCVITEMAVSPGRTGEAYRLVQSHGTPELTTIDAALERRRILCAAERA